MLRHRIPLKSKSIWCPNSQSRLISTRKVPTGIFPCGLALRSNCLKLVEMRRTATQDIENKSPQIKDKRPIPFGMSRLSPVSRKSCIQTSLIYGTVCFLVRLAHEMRFGESISGAEAPSQTHDNTRAQRNEFGCSNSLVSQKV